MEVIKEVVVDTEENLIKIIDACKKGGHSSVAAMSTVNVPRGSVRLTILPNSAFTGGTRETKEEWLAVFREIKKFCT